MRKPILLTSVLIITMLLFAETAYGARLSIKDISAPKNVINQYELFELDIMVSGSCKNPHDPEEVDLAVHITAPNAEALTVPAFFTGEKSLWKARFTPIITGKFTYYLTLKTQSKTHKSEVYNFDVKPGAGNGFLRKSKTNSFYPVFDSGKSFFGIGHNLGWVTDNIIPRYRKYFIDLGKNGCNLTRVWINNPWTLCIEDKEIGVYNIKDSGKLDSLLKLAEEHGVYIILVLDSYGSLMEREGGSWQEGVWKKNPYNKVNGGPCEDPWDFFTNEEAKRHYKNKLRYVMSRFGHSPHIMAFELWNELDTPEDWTREMLSYIKSINPHGQLLTTSLGYPWDNNFDEPLIWDIEEIDIIQRHVFGNQARDITGNLISVDKEFSKKYRRPILIGEFGMDWGKNDKDIDKAGKGVALHNSIWAAMASKSFGSALNWWWAGYVRGKNLYPHYQALRNFVQDVNWNSSNIKYVKTTPLKVKIPRNKKVSYSDVTIHPKEYWGHTSYKDFTIDNNGDVWGGDVNHYLQGISKQNLKIDPIFHVYYPADGKFIIEVGIVSREGCLVAYLDGKEVLRKEFTTGPGKGPWKRSLHRKDYNIYQCVYNTREEIDVPKGEHTIRLTNTGKDWIGIKKLILTNYMSNAFANARVVGLVVDKEILLWIQNKDNNWRNAKKGIEPPVITGASFDIKDVENGTYNIEWWDTYEGKVTSSKKIKAKNNTLHVPVALFSKDLACKIKR